METEPIVARNVALLLEHDRSCEDRFIGMSRAVGEQITSDIRLNRKNMRAHISLYNVLFPEKNLAEVDRRLEILTADLSPIELHFDGTSRVKEYVFVDAQVNDILYAMHMRVIEALNDLREGHHYEQALALAGDNEQMRSNILEVGMMLARKNFQPHVTVAHTQTEGEAEAARSILSHRSPKIQTTVPSIHTVKSGPWGTCKKIIKEFPLRKTA